MKISYGLSNMNSKMAALNKIARYFGMTIEPIINFDDTTLLEVTIGNKMLIK